MALTLQVGTPSRITRLARPGPKTNWDFARNLRDSTYVPRITACPGLLSVTESVALPPQPKGGHMSKISAVNFREWLVPPVLMPVFLVLLIAAAMVIQW